MPPQPAPLADAATVGRLLAEIASLRVEVRHLRDANLEERESRRRDLRQLAVALLAAFAVAIAFVALLLRA